MSLFTLCPQPSSDHVSHPGRKVNYTFIRKHNITFTLIASSIMELFCITGNKDKNLQPCSLCPVSI